MCLLLGNQAAGRTRDRAGLLGSLRVHVVDVLCRGLRPRTTLKVLKPPLHTPFGFGSCMSTEPFKAFSLDDFEVSCFDVS